MVDLAVGLLQPQDDVTAAAPPPPLILVNLRAGRGSTAALCRRCCMGEVGGIGRQMHSFFLCDQNIIVPATFPS